MSSFLHINLQRSASSFIFWLGYTDEQGKNISFQFIVLVMLKLTCSCSLSFSRCRMRTGGRSPLGEAYSAKNDFTLGCEPSDAAPTSTDVTWALQFPPKRFCRTGFYKGGDQYGNANSAELLWA